jgi:hypothetical protein
MEIWIYAGIFDSHLLRRKKMRKIKILAGLIMLFSASFLFPVSGQNALPETTGLLSSKSKEKARDKKFPSVRVSNLAVDSAEPNIAAAPDGSVYLIWVEHKANKEADIFLQKFDDQRKPFGESVRVNPIAGKATAWRGDAPTVKVGSDNTVYVGWTASVKVEDGMANDLYLSVSRNGGRKFDAPVKVNDDAIPADRGMHSLAIDKNNRIYFSWLDERYLKKVSSAEQTKNGTKPEPKDAKHQHVEHNRDVYIAISKDGGKSFGANRRLASDACPCCKTSLIAAPDGRIYVSWRQVLPDDFRHIAVTSSNDEGNSFVPPTIVSDDKWQIGGCPVSGAGLAVGADNILRTVWYTAGDAGKPGLYMAESKDGGKTFSPRIQLYEGRVAGTPLLLSDKTNALKIVWQSDGKIWQLNTQTAQSGNEKVEEIGAGRFPAAAITGEKLFVGFVQNEGNTRSIWLY